MINITAIPAGKDRNGQPDSTAKAYQKPRVVTTVEELDALPVGSVVLDRLDICYRLYIDPAHKEPVWCVVGELAPSRPHGWLPATVLHEGETA